MKTPEERIKEAMDMIYDNGGFDGGHHKMWVIDQVVRALMRSNEAYKKWVKEYSDGEDGPDTYMWDEGIAP